MQHHTHMHTAHLCRTFCVLPFLEDHCLFCFALQGKFRVFCLALLFRLDRRLRQKAGTTTNEQAPPQMSRHHHKWQKAGTTTNEPTGERC